MKGAVHGRDVSYNLELCGYLANTMSTTDDSDTTFYVNTDRTALGTCCPGTCPPPPPPLSPGT